jgi:tetratricopeptide (TPR) repeat protein
VEDEERKRRFVQEAKAAAALEHPHIGVIYEIDEAEGVTFIAMELIRGDKLGDVIEKERLSVSRALDLGIEVAEGLARAHDKGIVHRDLKPGNIMLTEDGHAKIIDFGLAKLVEPLSGGSSEAQTAIHKETDPGKIMGTVTYMSPEQARGIKVDHRSDVFSYGIVLYEMLSGKPPFQGATGMDTLHAIMKESAQPLTTLGGEVPEEASSEIRRVLDKCLAKEPAERYQTMKDAVVDLRTARRRLESGTFSAVSGVHAPVVEGEANRWPWAIVGGIAVLLAFAAAVAFFLRPSTKEAASDTPTKRSIAVLYFENNTGDPELDWLRTALTDMLVTDLSQSPEIEVLTTDRLYQILRDMNRLDERITSFDVVQEVAERGGVDSVLLGSFVKAGENIRISVRLQEVESGKVLTTEKVEGVGESSIFPMVDDLTRRIKNQFAVPETADATLDRDLKDVTTSSLGAYRSYAEGLELFDRGKQEESIPDFEKAVELDPTFAMALAKLAAVHSNLGHPKEADEYRIRAYEHVDRLSARERYYIEGHYYWRDYETIGRAIDAFAKGLELYPGHESNQNNLGLSYLILERFEEATELFEDLVRRGSTFTGSFGNLLEAYSATGEQEKSLEVMQEFVSEHPANGHGYSHLGLHFLRFGEMDKALEAFKKAQALAPEDNSTIEDGRWQMDVLREQWTAAEASAEKIASEGDPFSNWMRSMNLSVTKLYRGRSGDALGLAKQAASAYAEPGDMTAAAAVFSSDLLLAKNEPTRALAEAKRAEREDESGYVALEAMFQMARAHARLEQWDEAQSVAEELRRKAESIPGERDKRSYRWLLGEIALARGDNEKAIAELERASSMLPPRGFPLHGPGAYPPHVPVWFSLAYAYLQAGDDDNAAVWFTRIAESSTEHILAPVPYVRSFYFLGKIHEERGETDEARKYYRRFVEFWGDGDIDRDRVEEARSKL